MDSGLTVKWDDRIHPSQAHFDRMENIGVPKGSVTPTLSYFTSEVMKVRKHEVFPSKCRDSICF